MAGLAFVKAASAQFNSGTTSAPATFSGTVTSGDSVIVGVTGFLSTSGQVPTVADGVGNIYNLATYNVTASGLFEGVWYSSNVVGAAGLVVTASVVSGSYLAIAASEFTGGVTVIPYGQNIGTATSANPSTGNVPIEANGRDLLIGVACGIVFANGFTLGSGFSSIANLTGGATAMVISMEYQLGLTTATPATWTVTSEQWAACAASFRSIDSQTIITNRRRVA